MFAAPRRVLADPARQRCALRLGRLLAAGTAPRARPARSRHLRRRASNPALRSRARDLARGRLLRGALGRGDAMARDVLELAAPLELVEADRLDVVPVR